MAPTTAGRQGAAHQADLAAQGSRHRSGSWYTPADVVERLLDITLEPLLDARAGQGANAISAIRVLDPACGDGAFVSAAGARIARALERAGMEAAVAAHIAYGTTVVGIDVDPVAADLCRTALAERNSDAGGPGASPHVLVADALLMQPNVDDRGRLDARSTWDLLIGPAGIAPGGFDLVIGNPPFLTPLRSRTSAEESRRQALAERFGDAASPLTDAAALFFLLGAELASPSGTVCFIEPLPFVAARDAAGVRAALLKLGSLSDLWDAQEQVFDAAVAVCAPVVVRGADPEPVRLWTGRTLEATNHAAPPDRSGAPWSSLVAAARHVPVVHMTTAGTVEDIATCTADFRDQYYGLVGAVEEADGDGDRHDGTSTPSDRPRLVTSGTIDPARLLWGRRSIRFAGASYRYPVVNLDRLAPDMADWAARRLVPKVLVATQTRMLEAVADPEGTLLPSVPVITVTTSTETLHRIAALVTSPPIAALAAARHLGTGLGGKALRLRAADIAALPLPGDKTAWDDAASSFEAAELSEQPHEARGLLITSGIAMCSAYGIDDAGELLAWWITLLPPVRT